MNIKSKLQKIERTINDSRQIPAIELYHLLNVAAPDWKQRKRTIEDDLEAKYGHSRGLCFLFHSVPDPKPLPPHFQNEDQR